MIFIKYLLAFLGLMNLSVNKVSRQSIQTLQTEKIVLNVYGKRERLRSAIISVTMDGFGGKSLRVICF
jgi:hypothetical protein